MADYIPSKLAVHEKCKALVQSQLDTIQSSLDQLMEAKNNETKSSAGDKYETGMAMIQNQEELYKRQQLEVRNRMNELKTISRDQSSTTIEKGSLVELTMGWFYISVALGKLSIGNQDVFALSLQSPLGIQFKGKSASDTILLNGKEIVIKSVH